MNKVCRVCRFCSLKVCQHASRSELAYLHSLLTITRSAASKHGSGRRRCGHVRCSARAGFADHSSDHDVGRCRLHIFHLTMLRKPPSDANSCTTNSYCSCRVRKDWVCGRRVYGARLVGFFLRCHLHCSTRVQFQRCIAIIIEIWLSCPAVLPIIASAVQHKFARFDEALVDNPQTTQKVYSDEFEIAAYSWYAISFPACAAVLLQVASSRTP